MIQWLRMKYERQKIRCCAGLIRRLPQDHVVVSRKGRGGRKVTRWTGGHKYKARAQRGEGDSRVRHIHYDYDTRNRSCHTIGAAKNSHPWIPRGCIDNAYINEVMRFDPPSPDSSMHDVMVTRICQTRRTNFFFNVFFKRLSVVGRT